MQVEVRRISDLTADPENARTHDKKNLDAIASSLEKFGQRKPIVVMPTGVILAGNGTWAAAKQLGWTEIQVSVVPADWDFATAKAYALADNRTAELADWDTSVLASQLIELDAEGWDITALGFDVPEQTSELNEDEGPLTFDEETEPITKLGDVYQLGRHRLMCGDSTSIDAVEALTENKTIDMAFTDPPYGVAYTGGIQFADKDSGKAVTNNREMIQNDDIDLYAEVMGILALKVQGPCYIWFADTKASKLYEAAETFGDIHALIIWVKNGGYGALNANYKQKHEPCLYWKPKGSTLRFTGATTETTIWEIDKDGKNKLHPTQKPIDLALKAIGNHDAKTVLDLFGGSGSTLIACEQTNRTCYMMELDPKYCDVIVKRWEALTGKKAELL
jgi:site-specific DNA-methyltransferase (adenine-specific)